MYLKNNKFDRVGNRVLKYALIVISFVVLIDAQTFCRTKVEMGTFITISVDVEDKNFVEEGFKILHDVTLSLSSYDPKALVYKLNNFKEVDLDNYLYEALQLSQYYYKQSDGYFDVRVGAITKGLFRFGEDERVPTSTELEKAKLSFEGLWFDKERATLMDGMKIDLGGMGKGFGVDKVFAFYKEKGVQKVVISASGDIRCLERCDVEVHNPFGDAPLASFKTSKTEMGISTSGNYNRYVQSTQYNHLIDPKSKKSQNSFISITLISSLPNSDLDAYATAASVMPLKKAYSFLENLDLAYIILQSNKELKLSPNISNYTTDLVIYDTQK